MADRLLARTRTNGKKVAGGNVGFYTLLHIRCGGVATARAAATSWAHAPKSCDNSRVASMGDPVASEMPHRRSR